MSGSSLDGLDIGAFHFFWAEEKLARWEMIKGETFPFSEAWKHRLKMAPLMTAQDLASLDAAFGRYQGDLVNFFLAEHEFAPDLISAHGHTVFHFPGEGFTTQIGNGGTLAATTGYTVACDFRITDIALGGEGAPFAPIADQLLFPNYDAYLNLGGIANISYHSSNRWVAFDITGANQVLDALANSAGLPYDHNGDLARSGEIIPPLFNQLNQLSYFSSSYPKSLGNDWVIRSLVRPVLQSRGALADKLRTVVEHIAFQTARSFSMIQEQEGVLPPEIRLLATGGGVHNHFLVEAIQRECEKICSLVFTIPDADQINFKESAMIALLGLLRIKGQPNVLNSVTGARIPACGGAIYLGWKKQI